MYKPSPFKPSVFDEYLQGAKRPTSINDDFNTILVPRAHDPSGLWQGSITTTGQKDRGLWGRECFNTSDDAYAWL